jgi:hypothetical protein
LKKQQILVSGSECRSFAKPNRSPAQQVAFEKDPQQNKRAGT